MSAYRLLGIVVSLALLGTAVGERPPIELSIESVDLDAGRALVRLSGVTRSPEPRCFVFSDEKGLPYPALGARCRPARRGMRCTLALPSVDREARLVQLTLHLDRLAVVPMPGQAIAKFDAARQAQRERQMGGRKAFPVVNPRIRDRLTRVPGQPGEYFHDTLIEQDPPNPLPARPMVEDRLVEEYFERLRRTEARDGGAPTP